MPTELHLFDFDGTLFRSPDPPDGYEGSWGADPQALQPPMVPLVPGPEWWNQDVLLAARAALWDPNSYAVLLTGRPDHLFRDRVLDLLEQQGLDFDQALCNPSRKAGTTAPWKRDYLLKYLDWNPDVRHVVMWDDDEEKIPIYIDALRNVGVSLLVHQVREPAKRVAGRWISRLARRETVPRPCRLRAGSTGRPATLSGRPASS